MTAPTRVARRRRCSFEYFQIGHYAGYDLVGRTEELEPIPTDPDFKATNRLWLFALYPILAPQEESAAPASSGGVMPIPSAVTTTGRSARATVASAV